MIPERVGPYTIERTLGAGGMGTVYLGRHVETGEPAAVKVLPPALAREPGFVARFTREIEALRQLVNPHVVRLYESGQDGELWFYAMEYVEGETVAARLRRTQRMPWREVADIAVQICSALKAAHDAGIIHRDLKPSNLIVTAEGQVKLTDFGVAQIFSAGKLTLTGGIIGTAEYMSPEQAQGQRATKKSDLYSLGALMYVMLTGRPPFQGRTTLEIIQKHKYGQFDKPSRFVDDLPRWLEEIVVQLLAKDPDKRPPDAYVLSRRLQEVIHQADRAAGEQTMASGDRGPEGGLTTVPAEAAGGMGTLMRDLVRAEVEAVHAPSLPERLLNNTWVLVALLVLLIAGGVIFFQSRHLTPEQRFARGEELMRQPPGEQWLTARDEYFDPLLREDAATWQPRVQPYLDRIRLYELRTALDGSRRGRRFPAPRDEAERFLQLAQNYRAMGDTAAARRTLIALTTLLAGQPDHKELRELAAEMLQELNTTAADAPDRFALLKSSLDRASQLAEEGRRDEAARIWRSVIELYGPDPDAQQYVRTARTALAAPAEGHARESRE